MILKINIDQYTQELLAFTEIPERDIKSEWENVVAGITAEYEANENEKGQPYPATEDFIEAMIARGWNLSDVEVVEVDG